MTKPTMGLCGVGWAPGPSRHYTVSYALAQLAKNAMVNHPVHVIRNLTEIVLQITSSSPRFVAPLNAYHPPTYV
jgi:hypothetical protein